MENKLNPATVGAFVLILGAALIAGVLWLSVGLTGKQNYLPYASVVAESVAGLSIDAPVKYLGVDVGKVHSIAIDPQNSRQVLLGLLIARGTPVKQDSEAVLKTQGLTGIAYVELSGGSEGSPPLLATEQLPVPWIRSKPSLSTRLETVLGKVLTSVDQVSTNLAGVFDADNRAALKATLADTAIVAHSLAAQKAAISAGLQDAARTAHNTAIASAKLDPVLQKVSSAGTAVTDLARVAADASDRVGTTATAATSGVQQLRTETLPELSGLITELGQLASSLRHLSQQTERNPSSLIVGGPTRALGPGEINTSSSTSSNPSSTAKNNAASPVESPKP